MTEISQAVYRRQPIQRTGKALSHFLMWIDKKLSQPQFKPFALSLFISGTITTGTLYTASPWYELIVNKSDSLHGVLFILDKTTLPVCGDTTVFDMPDDNRFYKGARMIKIIKGCQGDVISVAQQEVFINDQSVGFFKDRSTQGNHKLYHITVSEIPEHKVYLYAPHSQSYDSRYLSFGLRDTTELLGTATRIF
jgi:conjugal transfer pilin signal peptidase TrbI